MSKNTNEATTTTMTKQTDKLRSELREVFALQYIQALDQNNADALAAFLQVAMTDPELSQVISEIDQAILEEEGIPSFSSGKPEVPLPDDRGFLQKFLAHGGLEARADHLQILERGTECWNLWRKECPDERPILCWTDLREKDLSKTDLSRADLHGADLSEADLSGAKLCGADLSQANLRRADLSEADLSGAHLTGANLTKANLSGATLTEATLREVAFSQLNLAGADLTRADLTEANLSGVKLSEATLRGTVLHNANLFRAILVGANLCDANLSKASLVLAELCNADLRGANLDEAKFHNANLDYADLSGTQNLHTAHFEDAKISRARGLDTRANHTEKTEEAIEKHYRESKGDKSIHDRRLEGEYYEDPVDEGNMVW